MFALALVPIVLMRAKVRHWLCFAGTLLMLYVPFAVTGGTDLDSLVVFAREWEFNSAIFGLLTTVLAATHAKFVLAAVCGALWLWYYRRERRDGTAVPRGDWVYGVLLAAAPVINAWYLLWLLPFAAVYPSRWAWTASVAVLLSYITGLNLNDYDLQAYGQPWWVRPAEFGAIGLAFLIDLKSRRVAAQT